MALFAASMCIAHRFKAEFMYTLTYIHTFISINISIFAYCCICVNGISFMGEHHTHFSKRTTKNAEDNERTWEQKWAKVNGTQSDRMWTSVWFGILFLQNAHWIYRVQSQQNEIFFLFSRSLFLSNTHIQFMCCVTRVLTAVAFYNSFIKSIGVFWAKPSNRNKKPLQNPWTHAQNMIFCSWCVRHECS